MSAVADLDRWRQRRASSFADRLEQSLLDAFDVAWTRRAVASPTALAAVFGVGVAAGVGINRCCSRASSARTRSQS